MDDVPKIAIVSPSFPPAKCGGVETSHFNLLKAFRCRGFNIQGFTFGDHDRGQDDEIFIRRGVPGFVEWFIRISVLFLLRLTRERGKVFQTSIALNGAIGALSLFGPLKHFDPDITIVPDMGAALAFFPKLPGKTIMVAHHNPARFLNEPLIGAHSERDTKLALKLEKLALKKVDAVVCPSQYMSGVFLDTYPFKGILDVIPNLVDWEVFADLPESMMRREMKLDADRPVIYIPAAGSIYKGGQFIFEIIRRVARGIEGDVGFYLSGTLEPGLTACLPHLPANARIYAPGHISYKENLGAIRECSLCLSPTLVENFGMAILEAQCFGLPVITFDVGGNKEIVCQNKTGFLLQFLDVEGLIERSLQLLKEPELRHLLSVEAKNHARRLFNQDLVVDKYLELFKVLNV